MVFHKKRKKKKKNHAGLEQHEDKNDKIVFLFFLQMKSSLVLVVHQCSRPKSCVKKSSVFST